VVRVGGSIEGSAVAVGPNAQAWIAPTAIAEVQRRGADELADRLRELEHALETEGQQLGEASGTVREQAEAVAEELARPAPRKSS
jgi:phosphoserine phosphatase